MKCSEEDFSQIYMYTWNWKIASIVNLANKAMITAAFENSDIITKKHLIDSYFEMQLGEAKPNLSGDEN